MTQNNRVFITGRGALTATGLSADCAWSALMSGQSGIAPITQWDIAGWPCALGGELKDFAPQKMLPDRKLTKVISPQDAMGICAAVQAVEHSQLIAYRDSLPSFDVFNDATGVYVGSPGNKYFQQYDFLPLMAKSQGSMDVFAAELFNEVHPMWLLRILPNNVLAYTGITYGFKGPNHNIANHAVGGMQALIEAYHAIKSGSAERAVVVAYDLALEPQGLFYYEQLGVLSASALKPFDRAHDGTVLADGAAALVLESEASVAMRQATCYGEVLAGLSTTEAQGLFSIEAEGAHLASLLKATLAHASVRPEELGLIVAHANGNVKSDISEAHALDAVFGNQTPPVTGFKWSTGHTVSASGLVDSLLATFALKNKCAPGIANLSEKAQECSNLSVSADHQALTGDSALIINRGFAGCNGAVVIKACG